jgi:putative Mg2+ transporter-C (MgtC) family protein
MEIAMITDLDIAVRLALAALLGSLVGFERERLLWAAGIRTHMLVCVGSCLLMIVSAYGFEHALAMPHVILDPSRIAAQVVSGIGFLGAGSILMRGQMVRGLTTAASIWAVAALGLAAGGGLYFAAVISTVIILVILAGIKPIEDAYRARVQSCTLDVWAARDAFETIELKKLLGVRASQIKHVLIKENGSDDSQRLRVQLVRVSKNDIRLGVDRLRRASGVTTVEVAERMRSEAPLAD